MGRPQLLVVALAILVAIAVLVLGQASEDETRSRAHAAQVDSAAHAAAGVAGSFGDRLALIRDTLRSLALTPQPDTSPIGLAVQRGDIATLQAITVAVQRQFPRYVLRAYIATRGEAFTIVQATIVAASPADTGLVGQRLTDIPGPTGASLRAIVATLSAIDGGLTDVVPGTADIPSRELAVVTIGPRPAALVRDVGATTSASLATIVVEIDFARMFADAAAASLAPGDDAYVLDSQRLLVGRARGPTPFPPRDLHLDPFVQLIGPTTPAVVRSGAADPLGAGTRLIASAPLALATNQSVAYSILLVRDTSPVDRDLDAALTQLALFRLVVVAMLLGLAYVLAFAGQQLTLRAVDQERLRLARDLHDLLGHSLSLITIKSQLARRLLPPGDTRASSEIVEIERVARESLQDVRHAVEGYRQPDLASALAGARAALMAASIEANIEPGARPLPVDVDATLAWAVREGVTNVIRHSRASSCSIRITRDGHEARVEITDDGTTAATSAPGSGLRGLQERAAARGGHVDAGPLPQGGFRVQVSIPL